MGFINQFMTGPHIGWRIYGYGSKCGTILIKFLLVFMDFLFPNHMVS